MSDSEKQKLLHPEAVPQTVEHERKVLLGMMDGWELYESGWQAIVKQIDALIEAVRLSALSTGLVWDCRICGFGVREGAALTWIGDHGEHYNVQSEKQANNGTAYCPTCNDETLRQPSVGRTRAVLEQLRDECAMLFDQEQQPVDQQRVEALNIAVSALTTEQKPGKNDQPSSGGALAGEGDSRT